MAWNIISTNEENAAEQYKDYVAVAQSDITKTCDAIIEALYNGLPKEAHKVEILNYVLNECKSKIKSKTINLK